MTLKNITRYLAAGVAFGAMAVAAQAADERGTVQGVVNNAAGQPVTGALVKLINAERHLTFMVPSQEQGRYQANDLPAGKYTVQGIGGGFESNKNARRHSRWRQERQRQPRAFQQAGRHAGAGVAAAPARGADQGRVASTAGRVRRRTGQRPLHDLPRCPAHRGQAHHAARMGTHHRSHARQHGAAEHPGHHQPGSGDHRQLSDGQFQSRRLR